MQNAAIGDDIILTALYFLWQRGAWQQAGPDVHLQNLIVSTLSQVPTPVCSSRTSRLCQLGD